MIEIRLTTPEKMLLALLKASLNEQDPEVSCFEGVSSDDWKECAQLAKSQGVLALAWEGVCRLPQNLQPYQNLKISWALAVEKYERKYARYCSTVNELSAFYQEHGIKMVQLKGVGLSTYYPISSHREGGDIDIYTYSASPDRISDKDANALADSLIEEMGIAVDRCHPKHSHFDYKGIPIENHKTFLDIDRCALSSKMEAELHDCIDPQEISLQENESILIPSDRFNILFVATHALAHYGRGMALHHLYDWACLIKSCEINIPAHLQERHFMRGINAMTLLCNEYLGTSAKDVKDYSMAKEMLLEILHPFDDNAYPESGAAEYIRFKWRRFNHTNRTRDLFLHTPWWKNKAFWEKLTKSVRWHLEAPKRLFNK